MKHFLVLALFLLPSLRLRHLRLLFLALARREHLRLDEVVQLAPVLRPG